MNDKHRYNLAALAINLLRDQPHRDKFVTEIGTFPVDMDDFLGVYDEETDAIESTGDIMAAKNILEWPAEDPQHECGTTCCVMGVMPMLFPAEFSDIAATIEDYDDLESILFGCSGKEYMAMTLEDGAPGRINVFTYLFGALQPNDIKQAGHRIARFLLGEVAAPSSGRDWPPHSYSTEVHEDPEHIAQLLKLQGDLDTPPAEGMKLHV